MKDIFINFKETDFYKKLRYTEKHMINKSTSLNILLKRENLEIFFKKTRVINRKEVASSFINYQIKENRESTIFH